jgi:hypothetical protein
VGTASVILLALVWVSGVSIGPVGGERPIRIL